MSLGKRIKEARLLNNITQQELSDLSGVALRTVQRIENDEVKASLHSIKALGAALKIDLTTTAEGESSKKSKRFLTNPKWTVGIFITLLISLIAVLIWPNNKTYQDDLNFELSTINCQSESQCDIELVVRKPSGEEVFTKVIGGSSYDKAVNAVRTEDGGFLVLGSTSSFGKGNYDILLVKLDLNGIIQWQRTYGDFLNDYGFRISKMEDEKYLIEGTRQICSTPNVSNDCYQKEWIFTINSAGIVQ